MKTQCIKCNQVSNIICLFCYQKCKYYQENYMCVCWYKPCCMTCRIPQENSKPLVIKEQKHIFLSVLKCG